MSVRMTVPTDLEDATARDDLMAQYTHRRLELGVTFRQIAHCLGLADTSPAYFEQRRPANPLISSLVRYGHVLDVRPVLTLEGVEAPTPAAVGTLLALGYVGAAALTRLIGARQHLGISKEGLSKRAGLSLKAVGLLERDDHEPHLATLQHYARALGGRLTARWEELC
jgi:transcriptional regulator with XRE-family HTH domain